MNARRDGAEGKDERFRWDWVTTMVVLIVVVLLVLFGVLVSSPHS